MDGDGVQNKSEHRNLGMDVIAKYVSEKTTKMKLWEKKNPEETEQK